MSIADCRLQIDRLLRTRSRIGCCALRARSPAAARPARRSARATRRCAPGNLDEAVAAYRKAVQAAPDNAELQDRAPARDAGRVARAPREGAASSSSRISSRRRSASTSWRASTIRATARPRPRSPSSIGRSAIASRRRGRKPAIRGDARARARRVGRADAQPGVARAAEPPLQQRQPPRHPELHRRAPPASTSPTTAKFARPRRPPSSSTASRSSRRSTRS